MTQVLVVKFRLTYRPALTNGVWRILEDAVFTKSFVDELGGVYQALRVAEQTTTKKLYALDGFPMRCCRVQRRNPLLKIWEDQTFAIPPPPVTHSDPGDETPSTIPPPIDSWPAP